MSVIETLTADPHRECRDRADALTGMLATLYTLACVGDYQELTDFIRRRRLDDKAIGKLMDRVEAAERDLAFAQGPWRLADPETLADMRLPIGAVILDAQHTAWQQWDADEWRTPGMTWNGEVPCSCNECQGMDCGPVFPVTILHNPKETKK